MNHAPITRLQILQNLLAILHFVVQNDPDENEELVHLPVEVWNGLLSLFGELVFRQIDHVNLVSKELETVLFEFQQEGRVELEINLDVVQVQRLETLLIVRPEQTDELSYVLALAPFFLGSLLSFAYYLSILKVEDDFYVCLATCLEKLVQHYFVEHFVLFLFNIIKT